MRGRERGWTRKRRERGLVRVRRSEKDYADEGRGEIKQSI